MYSDFCPLCEIDIYFVHFGEVTIMCTQSK